MIFSNWNRLEFSVLVLCLREPRRISSGHLQWKLNVFFQWAHHLKETAQSRLGCLPTWRRSSESSKFGVRLGPLGLLTPHEGPAALTLMALAPCPETVDTLCSRFSSSSVHGHSLKFHVPPFELWRIQKISLVCQYRCGPAFYQPWDINIGAFNQVAAALKF